MTTQIKIMNIKKEQEPIIKKVYVNKINEKRLTALIHLFSLVIAWIVNYFVGITGVQNIIVASPAKTIFHMFCYTMYLATKESDVLTFLWYLSMFDYIYLSIVAYNNYRRANGEKAGIDVV